MRKVLNVVKNNLFILIFIILLIIGNCTNVQLTTTDELFNFQNIYKMLNGYKIYKDANVITTPLFHFIGYIILKIFGENILIFRMYNLLMMTIMYFFIYKILRKLCNNKFSSFIYLFFIIIFTKELCAWGATYNKLAIDFVLLGIFLNLIWIEKQENHNFIQGIIMFLVFFTKQNMGILYILGICFYQIFQEKNIKNTLKQLITFIVLIGISMSLFIKFNIFNDFINYAILGLKEFVSENIAGYNYNIIQMITFAIFIISVNIFFIKINEIEKKEKDKILFLSILSILLMLTAFPIFDDIHTKIGYMVAILTIFSILDYLLFSHISLGKLKIVAKGFFIFIILIVMQYSLINCYSYFYRLYNDTNLSCKHPFFGGNLNEEKLREIENILKYIENSDNNVIVLTIDAAFYMIPLKRNNGAMDLPFLGNMGENGEENLIKEIEDMHNVKFLIRKDNNAISWQESEKINTYIRENLEYIEDIEKFEVYLKK